MSSPRPRSAASAVLRPLFAAIRQPTAHVGRIASRFSAVSRYVFDLVLWSRIVSRPSELARRSQAMVERGIGPPAPSLFITAGADEAATWEEGFAEVYRLLLANLQSPDLISRRRYGHPSPAFQGLYLWDSAFISQVWKPWDVAVALDCCMSVVEQAEPDGRIPHVTSHLTKSAYTQPPLIAWALWRLHDWEASERTTAALREAYPVLAAYARWLDRNRRLPNGLYFWAHPYESGVENAPRFSSADERELADTIHLGAPDFSAYVVLQREALAAMARELNLPDDVTRWDRDVAGLRTAINEHLWHDGDGCYYDVDARTGVPVRSLTIASLMPLWAGVPDKRRAQRLMAHIAAPDGFGTTIPLPSVGRSDPDFAKDMWRGPTWINTAYGVLLGVERYGDRSLAAALAHRLAHGVYRTHQNTHRVFEFYDPERFDVEELHRKKGNRWKHFTLGAKPRGEFVGWSGLVNTLVIEHLVGYARELGRTMIRPNLPRAMRARALAVRLPAQHLVIAIERLGEERHRGAVYCPDGVRHFELRRGEHVYLDELPIAQEGV